MSAAASPLAERVAALFEGRSGFVRVVATCDAADDLGLGEGRTNQNFIVTVGEGAAEERYFVRIGKDLPAFGVSRLREQAASRAASSAGIAPAVLDCSNGDVLALEFVDGRALTASDVRAAAGAGARSPLLRAIVDTLQRLHRVSPPVCFDRAPTARWSPPDLCRWLALAKEARYSRLPLLDGVDELVGRLEAAAGPLAEGGGASFCHFDLLPDNLVLDRDGAVWVVDFEYANAGEPLMDLAIFAMGCEMSAAEEREMLGLYLATPADDALMARFGALKVLAALRETLWGVVAEVSESSALSLAEAKAYADKLYPRLEEMRAAFDKRV